MHIKKKKKMQWPTATKTKRHKLCSGETNARVRKTFCQTHGVHKISELECTIKPIMNNQSVGYAHQMVHTNVGTQEHFTY